LNILVHVLDLKHSKKYTNSHMGQCSKTKNKGRENKTEQKIIQIPRTNAELETKTM